MKALIIGGNRFFGLRLAKLLVDEGHPVTLLNRGNHDDGLGDKVDRIRCERNNLTEFREAVEELEFDVVFDQVCYDYEQAKNTCEILKGKTNKLVFTSTVSVYGLGNGISETDFNPYTYQFDKKVSRDEDYGEAKRQAEVAYFKYADFPVVAARMPIVIGQDDYTGRFAFHIEHILNNEPIFFKNLDARLSLIRSDLAAELLLRLAIIDFQGPINLACSDPLSLIEYMNLIEDQLDKKMILSEVDKEEVLSPWGVPESWTVDLTKARSLKLPCPAIKDLFIEALPDL
ncbi:MAG: NAD-dependent dehydratase [Bdellovibrionaceae bacterium]|nr:NAD-dependent dehydratase [Pseudobdellovibrionaceae bacterium]|tara:strand:- start:142933 stop:143793 length:861 start_codon:yes stop_codon:yes gene_type:complete